MIEAGCRRGAASYSRCFAILEVLLLSVDGVHALAQSKEKNLMNAAAVRLWCCWALLPQVG